MLAGLRALAGVLFLALSSSPAFAQSTAADARAHESLRVAVYHAGLGRNGPGILLRDIRRAEADVLRARDTITALAPDILLLLDFDWDLTGAALSAFGALLTEGGHAMPHTLAPRPNTGIATGLDLDGDGRLGTNDDAQGWAEFAGGGGLALLSRWPIDADALIDHTGFLWRDLPDARLPRRDGRVFPDETVFAIQRLASVAAFEVPVRVRGAPLSILAYHAGPPVFGGAENRNFNRNADETAFWHHRLGGRFGPLPAAPFVLLANANLDPERGDGDQRQMRALLSLPQLQDPRPSAPLPATGATDTATAHWPDGPGALRVDYALPSADLAVVDAGLSWPAGDARHALVWVDLEWPP